MVVERLHEANVVESIWLWSVHLQQVSGVIHLVTCKGPSARTIGQGDSDGTCFGAEGRRA